MGDIIIWQAEQDNWLQVLAPELDLHQVLGPHQLVQQTPQLDNLVLTPRWDILNGIPVPFQSGILCFQDQLIQ
jgi:hypothetical protein